MLELRERFGIYPRLQVCGVPHLKKIIGGRGVSCWKETIIRVGRLHIAASILIASASTLPLQSDFAEGLCFIW